ncbi:MAG: DUF3097 domain-containing protein [Actinomycetota bacterium]|nr:DUF3097 domain-containing protein [Actinomycetota bacterium]
MSRDILDEFEQQRRQAYTTVVARVGDVVEDRASGFCGDIVAITSEAVSLRDRHGRIRQFRYKPGGFLIGGRPVTIVRQQTRGQTPHVTNSGAVAGPARRAQVAKASRIWVEGRHDAELVQHVWGDELAELAIVVEPMHGIDELVGKVEQFQPSADRRLGVLVDHLVPGSKEDRITRQVTGRHVLVTGHPFVDVWAGIRPEVMNLAEWPHVPRTVEWKQGLCAALGVSLTDFWPHLRNRVRTFADLRPELVGAVEQLIDFVAPVADAVADG